MEKAKAEKIIVMREDGSWEEIVKHGCALEILEDNIKVDFIEIGAFDMLKITVGFVESCIQMGLAKALDDVLRKHYGETQEEGAEFEKLQANNGNQGRESADTGE